MIQKLHFNTCQLEKVCFILLTKLLKFKKFDELRIPFKSDKVFNELKSKNNKNSYFIDYSFNIPGILFNFFKLF